MSDYGVVTEAGTLRFERKLPAPRDRVWCYLSEPEFRRRWLAVGDIDLAIGGRLVMEFDHAGLSPADIRGPGQHRGSEKVVATGHVVRCEPPSLLVHTWSEAWGESEVSFELEEAGSETLLILTHRRLQGAEAMVDVAAGWHAHLEILASKLSGCAAPAFWPRHAALERDYRSRPGRDRPG